MHHQQAAQPVAPCGDADVCIYLLCHADRRTNRCHPSEATMAKAKELMESGRTNRKAGTAIRVSAAPPSAACT